MLQFIHIMICGFQFTQLVSIHLMLQFIGASAAGWSPGSEFQYISCCSLSHLIASLVIYCCSFQYISCCSLSYCVISLLCISVFQYISCCSLSRLSAGLSLRQICFNTSHVVVYPRKRHFKTQIFNCFNTSHVVVYRLTGQAAGNQHMFQYISCCSLSPYP